MSFNVHSLEAEINRRLQTCSLTEYEVLELTFALKQLQSTVVHYGFTITDLPDPLLNIGSIGYSSADENIYYATTNGWVSFQFL